MTSVDPPHCGHPGLPGELEAAIDTPRQQEDALSCDCDTRPLADEPDDSAIESPGSEGLTFTESVSLHAMSEHGAGSDKRAAEDAASVDSVESIGYHDALDDSDDVPAQIECAGNGSAPACLDDSFSADTAGLTELKGSLNEIKTLLEDFASRGESKCSGEDQQDGEPSLTGDASDAEQLSASCSSSGTEARRNGVSEHRSSEQCHSSRKDTELSKDTKSGIAEPSIDKENIDNFSTEAASSAANSRTERQHTVNECASRKRSGCKGDKALGGHETNMGDNVSCRDGYSAESVQLMVDEVLKDNNVNDGSSVDSDAGVTACQPDDPKQTSQKDAANSSAASVTDDRDTSAERLANVSHSTNENNSESSSNDPPAFAMGDIESGEKDSLADHRQSTADSGSTGDSESAKTDEPSLPHVLISGTYSGTDSFSEGNSAPLTEGSSGPFTTVNTTTSDGRCTSTEIAGSVEMDPITENKTPGNGGGLSGDLHIEDSAKVSGGSDNKVCDDGGSLYDISVGNDGPVNAGETSLNGRGTDVAEGSGHKRKTESLDATMCLESMRDDKDQVNYSDVASGSTETDGTYVNDMHAVNEDTALNDLSIVKDGAGLNDVTSVTDDSALADAAKVKGDTALNEAPTLKCDAALTDVSIVKGHSALNDVSTVQEDTASSDVSSLQDDTALNGVSTVKDETGLADVSIVKDDLNDVSFAEDNTGLTGVPIIKDDLALNDVSTVKDDSALNDVSTVKDDAALNDVSTTEGDAILTDISTVKNDAASNKVPSVGDENGLNDIAIVDNEGISSDGATETNETVVNDETIPMTTDGKDTACAEVTSGQLDVTAGHTPADVTGDKSDSEASPADATSGSGHSNPTDTEEMSADTVTNSEAPRDSTTDAPADKTAVSETAGSGTTAGDRRTDTEEDVSSDRISARETTASDTAVGNEETTTDGRRDFPNDTTPDNGETATAQQGAASKDMPSGIDETTSGDPDLTTETASSETVVSEITSSNTTSAETSQSNATNTTTAETTRGDGATTTETIPSYTTSKETVSSDATTKETVSSDATTKETASSDATTRETIPSDTTTKETISSDPITKEIVPSDAPTKETASSGTTTKETVSSDASTKEAATDGTSTHEDTTASGTTATTTALSDTTTSADITSGGITTSICAAATAATTTTKDTTSIDIATTIKDTSSSEATITTDTTSSDSRITIETTSTDATTALETTTHEATTNKDTASNETATTIKSTSSDSTIGTTPSDSTTTRDESIPNDAASTKETRPVGTVSAANAVATGSDRTGVGVATSGVVPLADCLLVQNDLSVTETSSGDVICGQSQNTVSWSESTSSADHSKSAGHDTPTDLDESGKGTPSQQTGYVNGHSENPGSCEISPNFVTSVLDDASRSTETENRELQSREMIMKQNLSPCHSERADDEPPTPQENVVSVMNKAGEVAGISASCCVNDEFDRDVETDSSHSQEHMAVVEKADSSVQMENSDHQTCDDKASKETLVDNPRAARGKKTETETVGSSVCREFIEESYCPSDHSDITRNITSLIKGTKDGHITSETALDEDSPETACGGSDPNSAADTLHLTHAESTPPAETNQTAPASVCSANVVDTIHSSSEDASQNVPGRAALAGVNENVRMQPTVSDGTGSAVERSSAAGMEMSLLPAGTGDGGARSPETSVPVPGSGIVHQSNMVTASTSTEPESMAQQHDVEGELQFLQQQVQEKTATIRRLQTALCDHQARANHTVLTLRTQLRRRDRDARRRRQEDEERASATLSRLLFLEGQIQRERQHVLGLLREKDDVLRRQEAALADLEEKNAKLHDALKQAHGRPRDAAPAAQDGGKAAAPQSTKPRKEERKEEGSHEGVTRESRGSPEGVTLRRNPGHELKVPFPPTCKDKLKRHRSNLELNRPMSADALLLLEEGDGSQRRFGSQESLLDDPLAASYPRGSSVWKKYEATGPSVSGQYVKKNGKRQKERCVSMMDFSSTLATLSPPSSAPASTTATTTTNSNNNNSNNNAARLKDLPEHPEKGRSRGNPPATSHDLPQVTITPSSSSAPPHHLQIPAQGEDSAVSDEEVATGRTSARKKVFSGELSKANSMPLALPSSSSSSTSSSASSSSTSRGRSPGVVRERPHSLHGAGLGPALSLSLSVAEPSTFNPEDSLSMNPNPPAPAGLPPAALSPAVSSLAAGAGGSGSESSPFKSIKNVFRRRSTKHKKRPTSMVVPGSQLYNEAVKEHFKKFDLS